MAKNTRQVTQYEVYTVRRHYQTLRGEQQMDHMEPVAVFDDKELAEAYIDAAEKNPSKLAEVKKQTYSISENWQEVEPTEKGFSLPFNPTYEAVDSVETEAKAQ